MALDGESRAEGCVGPGLAQLKEDFCLSLLLEEDGAIQGGWNSPSLEAAEDSWTPLGGCHGSEESHRLK